MTSRRVSPPDAARRRFLFVQSCIIVAFAAATLVTGALLPSVEGTSLRWLLAAGPVLLLVLWAWQFYKMIRDDDEMMQAFHLRVVAISGMLVLLGGTIWGVLERLLGVPALPAFMLLPAYAVVSSLVMALVARRS